MAPQGDKGLPSAGRGRKRLHDVTWSKVAPFGPGEYKLKALRQEEMWEERAMGSLGLRPSWPIRGVCIGLFLSLTFLMHAE